MTTKRPNPAGALAAALAVAATAALGACGQRAAPSPAFAPSPADSRTTELAGAPEDATPAPAPAPLEVTPPPPPAAATSLPPSDAPPPPPPPARRDDEVIYDLGPVTPAPGASEATRRPRVRRTYETARAEPPPVEATAARPAPARPAPAPVRAAPATAPRPAASTHVPAPPPPQKAKPAPRAEKPAKAAAAEKPAKGAKTKESAAGSDRGAKLQALQTALRDAVTRRAELSAPERPSAGQAADVALTLPADFAQTVRDEAAKAGLADAAATVNLTAQLSGDGYTVTPGETQAQPLTVGQPTEFHWTVTAQPNARGPLRADVGADMLGAGSESLSLGAVTRAEGGGLRLSSRAVGAGLLALIAVVVLAWLARGGRTPAQREAARRSAARSRRGINPERPLDMTRTPFEAPPRDTPGGVEPTRGDADRRDPPEAPR